MNWKEQLKGDSIRWLVENADPGVRYLARRDLLDTPGPAGEFLAARGEAHGRGPIAAVMAEMHPDGYWVEPGPGYNPKYRSTVWAMLLLAQLGANVAEDPRLERACAYVLEHGLTSSGQFSVTGAPSGTADCLQGNLAWALLELGVEPAWLEVAFDWMARSVTGEGIAPLEERHAAVRYYAGKCGPVFACGSNNKLPCAWGGAKVMLAFSRWPAERRTPALQRAIRQGVDFFLNIDPAGAAYPCGYSAKPSQNWWKFGFPVFYVTDLLQVAEAMANLGYGNDPRLAPLFRLIVSKQDSQGRWPLEYDYTNKTWCDFGVKKQPNPWVTLRALKVLKTAGETN